MTINYLMNVPNFMLFGKHAPGKLQAAIEDFWNRPEKAMEVVWEPGDPYKSAATLAAALSHAVTVSGKDITVRKRDNSVYLYKEPKENKRVRKKKKPLE